MPAVFEQIKKSIRKIVGGELKISSPAGPQVYSLQLLGITASCHRQWPTYTAFREGWDRLSQVCSHASTFTSRIWQQDGLGATLRAGALRLITATRGEQLVAILPMEITPTGFLESIGHGVSDYLDPLVDPACQREAWAAIIALLDAMWDRELKQVTLQNIRHDSASREILPNPAAAHGLTCDQMMVNNAARIKLPATWDAYLESLDSHERKELRRKIRKAEEQAQARLVLMDGANWDDLRLTNAMDLIEAAEATKGEWFAMNVRPMLSRIATDLAKAGRLRLLTLMLGETPAAALLEFPTSRGPLLYNSGYDPGQRQWSPGAVMFGLALKRAIEEGSNFFDLLRGREEYKYRMGAADDPLFRISLHRP